MRLKRYRLPMVLASLLMSACALAYEISGHHFTLVRIYLDQDPQVRVPDDLRYVELFCAELPDLARELDAITQRALVAKSWEMQWGLLGRCSGPTTRQMFQTQYYLHGLTGDIPQKGGAPLDERVRLAVKGIVQKIDDDRAAGRQDRFILACARGFAAHLLGDSFAHSQLYSPGHRYPPGTGHFADGHEPDYLLSRDLMGIKNGQAAAWADSASQLLMQRNAPSMLKELMAKTIAEQRQKQGNDYGEDVFMNKLISSPPGGWQPFKPPLNSLRPTSIWNTVISFTCDQRIQTAFPGESSAGKLKCVDVWSYYVKTAAEVFRRPEIGLDPAAAGYGTCQVETNLELASAK